MQLISCDELQQVLQTESDARVIDVRSQEEWDAGHIEVAELIPLPLLVMLAPERLTDMHEKIIVCCHSGGRAVQALQQLESMGYTNIFVLDGGYCTWKDKLISINT